MDQIRINKEFAAFVIDDDLPSETKKWRAFGGEHGSITSHKMLIDRYVEMKEFRSGDVDFSNGTTGIPIRIDGIERHKSGAIIYYDYTLPPKTD